MKMFRFEWTDYIIKQYDPSIKNPKVGKEIHSLNSFRHKYLSKNSLSNNAFITGIDFKENIDFSRGNKFSMTVESGIDSSNPVVLFLYFHSLVSI